MPQVHHPGEEAKVDLSEALVEFRWGRETVLFFQMRAFLQRGGLPLAAAHRQPAGLPRRIGQAGRLTADREGLLSKMNLTA